nr:hypothetical protein [Akkermansiaceae bacterium]
MSEESTSTPAPGRLNRLRNWLSLAGMVLVAVDLFATHANPYMGILAYVVAPMFFFMGLGLVILGYILETRRIRKGVPRKEGALVLRVDLSRKRDRQLMAAFVLGSIGFLLLTAFGSYETYHLMETNSFCGQACHTPMEPQFSAHQHSSHAQVDC